MAKLYGSPFPRPEFPNPYTPAAYDAAIKAYEEANAKYAREANPNDPLAGEVITFPVADDQAWYMVYSSRPLALIFLEVGDRYHIGEPYIRGLRISDVRQIIQRRKAIAEMFKNVPQRAPVVKG